jgi:glycerol-3-phosphate acyltransferase PlsX
MKIAIDAMGGDLGSSPLILGASDAYRELGVQPVLVGDRPHLESEVRRLGLEGVPFAIVHAPETVGMDESATDVRKKKRSSVWVAAELLKDGEVAAAISAGHTGASMAAALFVLGRIPGVDRPAIAAVIPHLTGAFILVDAGANVDCKPTHLLQFARMGFHYAQIVLNLPLPRIGLISNGEEENKGNELVRETQILLKNSGLPFIGNVEGKDLFHGKADVVVTDGFVGNVVLKTSEGLAEAFFTMMRQAARQSFMSRIGGLLIRPAFATLKRKVDYAEYGGAPLLGVNGPFFICHGRSERRAIRSAFRVARDVVGKDMIDRISRELAPGTV